MNKVKIASILNGANNSGGHQSINNNNNTNNTKKQSTSTTMNPTMTTTVKDHKSLRNKTSTSMNNINNSNNNIDHWNLCQPSCNITNKEYCREREPNRYVCECRPGYVRRPSDNLCQGNNATDVDDGGELFNDNNDNNLDNYSNHFFRIAFFFLGDDII